METNVRALSVTVTRSRLLLDLLLMESKIFRLPYVSLLAVETSYHDPRGKKKKLTNPTILPRVASGAK